MNDGEQQTPEGRGDLKGFYSYKNTFDKDSVWLDIPKHGMRIVCIQSNLRRAYGLTTGQSSSSIIPTRTPKISRSQSPVPSRWLRPATRDGAVALGPVMQTLTDWKPCLQSQATIASHTLP
jgi:hypothetical protein